MTPHLTNGEISMLHFALPVRTEFQSVAGRSDLPHSHIGNTPAMLVLQPKAKLKREADFYEHFCSLWPENSFSVSAEFQRESYRGTEVFAY